MRFRPRRHCTRARRDWSQTTQRFEGWPGWTCFCLRSWF